MIRPFFFTAMMVVASLQPALAKEDRIVVGWVEKVHIGVLDSEYKAKLDTGATTSSIDAKIISITDVKGEKTAGGSQKQRVVFSILDEDGKAQTLERDIVRFVRIKKKGTGYVRRPVVNMGFCIAGVLVKEEVNLAERENFIYPVLIGRNMLQNGRLIIDASKTFTSDAVCKAAPDKTS